MSQRPADQPAHEAPTRPDPSPMPETTLNNQYAENTAKRQARQEPLFGASDTTSVFLGWEDDRRASSFGFGTSGAKKRSRARPILYQGDSHLMTIAPTGAGKGIGVIIPNLLRYTGTVIAIDPKGENYQVTARRRLEMGQKIIVLDPFHVATKVSDCLNPLDLFKLPRSIMECDAEMLASLLSVGHEFSREPYWDDTGRAILAALIAHIASTSDKGECTLNQVRAYLYHQNLDYMLAELLDDEAVKNTLAKDEFNAYLAIPEDKTRPCVRSTATSYLKALGSPDVSKTLETSSFELADLVEGKPLTIYIIIPPEKMDSHRSLLRLWIGTLLTAVTSRRRLPRRRTLFLIDEAAQLGSLSTLRQAITLHRGYGMQVHTFWQDLSQLRLLYEKDWQTMINNSAVLQVFGIANFQMAREWADVVGKDPHELLSMDPQQAMVHMPGEGCRRCRRGNYLEDVAFQGMYEANERFFYFDEDNKARVKSRQR
jgi:type IV secretion system protein VirD4